MMSDKQLISFDYAIKYLLKNKADYDIIEGFISALFAANGYPPVKINALLESESNKEASGLKKSIADLIVEDAEGNKYIVEIERSHDKHFVHKSCFNSSRLVVDSISGNQDFNNIKKVFHITLLYFKHKILPKPILHGQTIFHEIDTAHPIKNIKIMNQGCITYNIPNIFPEYFFISIPLFNDQIHQEIDEWLYLMKHSEIKNDFKSRYIEKAVERLSILHMTDAERQEYYYYLKNAMSHENALEEKFADGVVKGKAEGKVEEKLEIARNMLSKNLDINLIASVTGLSITKIQQLLSDNRKI